MIEKLLAGKFPEQPFEFLAQALLFSTPVNASRMPHNMPKACKKKYDRGEMEVSAAF